MAVSRCAKARSIVFNRCAAVEIVSSSSSELATGVMSSAAASPTFVGENPSRAPIGGPVPKSARKPSSSSYRAAKKFSAPSALSA